MLILLFRLFRPPDSVFLALRCVFGELFRLVSGGEGDEGLVGHIWHFRTLIGFGLGLVPAVLGLRSRDLIVCGR